MPITLANALPSRLDWHRHRVPEKQTEPGDDDAGFVGLQAAYRSKGGLVRAEALAACWSAAGAGGYIELARHIVAGQLFSLRWHDAVWLPLFQVDANTHTVREAPRQVLEAFQGALGGWDLARWFLRGQAVLGGGRPVDLLERDLPAVLAVARADREAVAAAALAWPCRPAR